MSDSSDQTTTPDVEGLIGVIPDDSVQILSTTVVFTAIALLSIILRTLVCFKTRIIGWDYWTALVGSIFFVALVPIVTISYVNQDFNILVQLGITEVIPLEEQIHKEIRSNLFWSMKLLSQLFYELSVAFILLSMLRFTAKKLRVITILVMVVIVCWEIVDFVIQWVVCIPFIATYNADLPATCISEDGQYVYTVATFVWQIMVTMFLALAPVPMFWRIRQPAWIRVRSICLWAVFSLSSAFTMVRMAFFISSWDDDVSGLWVDGPILAMAEVVFFIVFSSAHSIRLMRNQNKHSNILDNMPLPLQDWRIQRRDEE